MTNVSMILVPNADADIANVADGLAIAITKAKSSLGSADVNVAGMARTMLATLLSSLATPERIAADVLTAYGNPKLKSGKPMTSLTSSSRDDIKGFGAMRRNVKSIFTIWENIASAPDIRPMVTAFVLNAKTYQIGDVTHETPRFVHTLLRTVNASILADAKANAAPVDADTQADADNGVVTGPVAPVGLIDRISELLVAFDAATDAERDMAQHAIAAFIAKANDYAMLNAATAPDAERLAA